MKILLLAVIVFATSGTTSECGADLPKSCTVLFRGLEVENGQVTDVVRPVCDNNNRPLSDVIEVYLDYRRISDDFTPLGRRHKVVSQIPDADGFDIIVSGPCLEGYYRTHYYVSGRGAPLDGGPGGSLPFEYEDTGWSKYFELADCSA
ncbi:MAG: hypothetical protein ACRDTE_29410 [Pseudonocardiaceae bacterium]